MKDVGTLLIEIKKPVGDVPLVYKRLRALTRTGAQALNMTMQDSHPNAVAQLRANWDGEAKQTRTLSEAWRGQVRTVLARNWNARLERERLDRKVEPDAEMVYAGINGSALAEETATNITSQFNGANVGEMIALRKGFPEFGIATSFYCGGRYCSVAGTLRETLKRTCATKDDADAAVKELGEGHFARRAGDKWRVVHEDSARVALPLWGTGKKVTELIIGPAGGHVRSTWRQLAAHFDRRDDIVLAEKQLDAIHRTEAEKEALASLKAARKAERDRKKRREIDGQIQAVVGAMNKRMQSLRDPIEAKLYGLTKIGRIGVVWKERRRKWFVTISYTRYTPPIETKGQAAAVNFGINVFLQAFAADESAFHVDGAQILHKRLAYNAARKRIQKSKRQFGRGSRGRGKRRRELPLTKRQGDETNWTQTFIRQLASDLIAWCKRRGVADLYLEDLSGVRDEFEQATGGQAHPEVKRRIHSWPYAETRMAIVREGTQHGVRVHAKGSRFVSQRCPSCTHTVPENVQEVTIPGPVLPLQSLGKGRWREVPYQRFQDSESKAAQYDLYRRQDKTYRFECVACGMKGQADIVACLNHLQDLGVVPAGKPTPPGTPTPLAKMQEAARASVSNDKRKKVRRTGT
jgi:transposase